MDNPEVIDVRDRPRPTWTGPGLPPAPDPLAEIHRTLAGRKLRSSWMTPARTRDGYLESRVAYVDRDPARHDEVAARALAELEDRHATS